ncbi:MAG: hypothetical protein KME26_22135 [Oscillatoria princeps RMCB-10]|nr:hypothetical protein [Oscillatoria princeps RMCB-10]
MARSCRWGLNRGAEISSLSGHSRTIISVAFSSDGRTLVSGSDDATVKIWRRVPS